MMSPMPFCPSFEPWAKLTPVHVRRSRPRIQNGGGGPLGRLVERLVRDDDFISMRSSAAQTKPTIGEMRSDLPTFAACAQSTPLVAGPWARGAGWRGRRR